MGALRCSGCGRGDHACVNCGGRLEASMRTTISKWFKFEAAHCLPNVPADHKCRRMHGHSYRVQVTLAGKVDPAKGWIVDFGDVSAAWRPLEKLLDHYTLNEVDGLANPTAEILAAWIFARMRRTLPQLVRVEVWETADSGAACEWV